MNKDELQALIPAYTLGALDANEYAEFEAWLMSDPEAQSLVAEYQALADSLVLLTPARHAPPHLGDDLRRRLAADRQRRTTMQARPVMRPRLRKRNRKLEFVGAVMAAVAAIVLAIGVFILSDDDTPSQENTPVSVAELSPLVPVEMFEAFDEDPDTNDNSATGEMEGLWGKVVVTSDGMTAMVAMWSLPEIATDEAFEVWLVPEEGSDSQMRSVSLFVDTNDDEPAIIEIPLDEPLHHYAAVGVSIEKRDGQHHTAPSDDPILGVPVPSIPT
ncbi:MAG: hypothetical protein D6737_00560 [Chloroflexi bacterium]|nr:MAG: hypothetical protein CUN54_01865 [Phototrophicales bacterium]RMF82858.1 MAG: hypothetical protein D6737_00560 [Chloroflexota bacterium]